jgi:monolysocardiolipin acyltransferase
MYYNMHISEWLNTTNVYNKDILVKALDHRPQNVPLITVSNHHSCFDDPGLWGNYALLYLCLNLF